MTLCVSNGRIVNPASGLGAVGDLWISDGRICCIKTEEETRGRIPEGIDNCRTIDATGKIVTPGLIDLHVHFREPGFEYKEDIESGCKAAAQGGFTTVCPMPNTSPAIDNGQLIGYVRDKAQKANGVHVLPVGSITEGQKGNCLADLAEMAAAGACGFSEDGKSVMDEGLMRDGMKKAVALNLPIFDHAEDESAPDSIAAEERMVARDIELAKETGCRLHLCHISAKGSLERIRNAKAEGIAVTAETAPHYVTFTAADVKGQGNKKMNPPLRSREDVEAVKAALKDGTLDAIATDHAPHSRQEKELDYQSALNGIIGLETSFAVSYTMLVRSGDLTLAELISAMSSRPAEILGIDKGNINVGKAADLAIFDIEEEYEIEESHLAGKSRNCPFLGMKVYGRPVATIAEGKVIWEEAND